MADTAALVVALSAQLTKFEKDMQQAGTIADKGVKRIEDRFKAMNDNIAGQLQNTATSFASRIGGLGSIAASLGPVGLAVAAGLGAIVVAFNQISDKVDTFVEKSKKLREAAETAGLTINQFRLLSQQGTKVGLDFEQTENFIDRLTVSIDELRKGGGPLFEQLSKIDAGLVRDIASAQDTASAIDILARAFHGLNDQVQKNALARAAGGRSGIAGGRLLDQIAEQGGLSTLQKQAEDTGKTIDEALNQRIVKLKVEIDEIKKRTDTLWGTAFSEQVLGAQKASAEFWERIAKAVVAAKNAGAASSASETSQATVFGRRFRGRDIPFVAGQEPSTLTEEALRAEGLRRLQGAGGAVPLPTAKPAGAGAPTPAPAAVELALMQRWIGLLGDAVTPAEALRLKILQIQAAQEAGGVTNQQAARALSGFVLAQNAAAVAARERLGIASQEEITTQHLAELQDQRAKGYVRSAEEMAQAEALIRKEAKQTAEAQAVRSAALPNLKQFELDAANLSKQLDTLAVSSLNNLSTSLVDVASGTKSAADGFAEFGRAVVKSITELVIKMLILQPIARSLQSTLGGLGALGSTGIPGFAAGTTFAPGGLAVVGEHGPELISLPRGSQVTPADAVNSAAAGGGDMNVNVAVDLKGANGDKAIEAAVNRGVQRAVQQSVSIVNNTAPSRQLRYSQLGT